MDLILGERACNVQRRVGVRGRIFRDGQAEGREDEVTGGIWMFVRGEGVHAGSVGSG